MILVGQYDSPYVRRVAISLSVLGISYSHDTLSVFGDFEDMRLTNPLARIPSLILDGGETLIDSAAILDHLDEVVGPKRALVPIRGEARRAALQSIALATGVIDKIGGGRNYELIMRPTQYRWPEWTERVTTQGVGALERLNTLEWPAGAPLDQVHITVGCAVDYVKITAPDLMPPGRFARLDALIERLRLRVEFIATSFTDYKVPRAT